MTSTSTTDAAWKATYTSRTGPMFPQGYLKEQIRKQVFEERPIMSLLKDKTKKAEKEMAENLGRELFGSPVSPKRNEGLRRIIAEAYDEHIGKAEEEMGAVDEVMKEREEAKVREVFDVLDEIFAEELNEDGALCSFTVQFDVDGKEYRYAAVLGGGMWYITGRETEGRKPEAFKAWIAETVLKAHRVEFEGQEL